MNLLKFLGAALVVGPLGAIAYSFWTGATAASEGFAALVSYVLGGALVLTGLVVLTHLFIRAARHPWASQTCPACLSDVPARASVCRYCRHDLAA